MNLFITLWGVDVAWGKVIQQLQFTTNPCFVFFCDTYWLQIKYLN